MAKKETTTAQTVSAKAASKLAAEVLKANPDIKEVYITSDGTAFYTRNDAQNHANSLKNREVFNHKRGTLTVGKPAAPETDELTGETAEENGDNAETPNTDE